MVKAICIDERNRPHEIPKSKWVKKLEVYTVIYAAWVMPQKELAFHLAEIDLDESCDPYTYFLASRFGFTDEELDKLIKLIQDCDDTAFSVDELLKSTELIKSDGARHTIKENQGA